MRRTLQNLLLVAAVASAPLAAAAAPSDDAPRHERRTFWSILMDRLKEAPRPRSAPPAAESRHADSKVTLPRLPHWITDFLDLDEGPRSTGT